MTPEESAKLVEDTANKLGEHFESVLILVSNSDGEGTERWTGGTGNFFARLGLAQEFIDKDRAELIADAIREGEEE